MVIWLVWMYPELIDGPIGRRHRSQRVRPEVDRLLFAEIADHSTDLARRDDILAMLVSARDETGAPLGDEARATSSSRCCSPGTRRPRRRSRGASSDSCVTHTRSRT